MTVATDGQDLTHEELQTLEDLLAKVSGRGAGLPGPLFRFVTEITATVNIDLLARDGEKGVLLAWRDDPFGTGWHVPGSIIRHREEIAHRISACAREEFGCAVDVADRPIALVEIFDDRGHSVSICFPVTLRGTPAKRVLNGDSAPGHGDLRWFAKLPAKLYPSHLIYRELLEAMDDGQLGEGVRLFTQHVGDRDAAQASAEGVISADTLLT